MRILISAIGYPTPEGYPCGPVTLGGVSKVMQTIANGMAERGHHVEVWCTNRLDQRRKLAPSTLDLVQSGVRVRWFNTHCIPFWPGTFGPSYTPELPGALDRELGAFDVVHLHEFRSYMALRLAHAAARRGIPYVVQPHGSTDVLAFYNSGGWKHIYDRLWGTEIVRNAAAAIALQDDEAMKLSAMGVCNEHLHVVPNSVDLALRAQFPAPGGFRAHHGIAPERRVLLFVGRMERRKGADVLLRALALLPEPRPLLALCGPDDGMGSALQALAGKLGIARDVLFTGALSGQPLWSAYLDSDVFVMPSLFDIFPLVILEACLAGKPMVVSSTCQISNLLEAAALIAEPEPQPIASALRRLLSDSLLRQQLAQGAQSLAETTFSRRMQLDRVEAIYWRVTRPTGMSHETVNRHS